MSFTIRLKRGAYVHQLSEMGGLRYSWGEHGPLEASWSMRLPRGFLHPALTQGVTVEIFYSNSPVWYGHLEEMDRDEWKVKAVGTADFLKNVASLTGVGEIALAANNIYENVKYATDPDNPLPWPLVRGFDFSYDETLPGGDLQPDFGTSGAERNAGLSIRQALDSFQTRTGKRWMVDERGMLHVPPAPTEPTLALSPVVPDVGLSLENYYSATYLRYLDHYETDGGVTVPIYETVYAVSLDAHRWGPRERMEDYDLEVQHTEANAQRVVDALQAEAIAAPTQGVQVTHGQVTNLNGTPISLPLLKTNVMVRHYGVLDVPGARNAHEWVINHFEMDTETMTATITPRHVTPRTLAQVIASVNAPPNPYFNFDSAA